MDEKNNNTPGELTMEDLLSPPFGKTVPVRMTAAMDAAMRREALQDGHSDVSSWLRKLVAMKLTGRFKIED